MVFASPVTGHSVYIFIYIYVHLYKQLRLTNILCPNLIRVFLAPVTSRCSLKCIRTLLQVNHSFFFFKLEFMSVFISFVIDPFTNEEEDFCSHITLKYCTYNHSGVTLCPLTSISNA